MYVRDSTCQISPQMSASLTPFRVSTKQTFSGHADLSTCASSSISELVVGPSECMQKHPLSTSQTHYNSDYRPVHQTLRGLFLPTTNASSLVTLEGLSSHKCVGVLNYSLSLQDIYVHYPEPSGSSSHLNKQGERSSQLCQEVIHLWKSG